MSFAPTFRTALHWLPAELARLAQWRSTGPDGDWYPPTLKALDAAEALLPTLEYVPEPTTTTNGAGAITIRWRSEGGTVEVLIDPNGKARGFATCERGRNEAVPDAAWVRARIEECQGA